MQDFTLAARDRSAAGHSYAAEVRPAYRQYHDPERWRGYWDWQVVFENKYRPRCRFGTIRGDQVKAEAVASLALSTYLAEIG